MESLLPIIVASLFVVGATVVWLFFGKEGVDKSKALQIQENVTPTLTGDMRVVNPAVFKKFTLLKTIQTSHNTKLLRFEIPGNKSLGLPIGRHISLMVHMDGNKVIRPYTPVSRPDEKGHFDILIKSYALGKMSPYLFNMSEGQEIDIRGPVGRFKYSPNMYKHIGLVCAGTGLTPCLQVVRCVLEGEHAAEEQTKMTLLFQNRTEEDILLREELATLEEQHPDRLQVFLFLSNPSDAWGKGRTKAAKKQRRGYIDNEFLGEVLPREECGLLGICGPSGFNEQVVSHLEANGFDKEKQIYVW